jgi:hypothetical protein
LTFSKKKPHAASNEAKIKVEQVQDELYNPPVQQGIATDVALLEGVPLRSMAMLVCRVWVKSDTAVRFYPCRSPLPTPLDFQPRICSPNQWQAVPAFLIHFS